MNRKPVIKNPEFWGKRLEEMAHKGAALGVDHGKMCKDCAFRSNQEHTQDYVESVDGAFQMLAWEGKFNCHTDAHEDAGKPCAGFLYAKEYLKSTETKDE